MNTKVYIDNLAAITTETELMDLFSRYGNVVDVRIALDRINHKPRGFGFVTMVTREGARAAIEALNGKALGTVTVTVSEACPVEEPAASTTVHPPPHRSPSYLY